jgi:fermentation-respiration switch protein FrsA (DUF1100 family)
MVTFTPAGGLPDARCRGAAGGTAAPADAALSGARACLVVPAVATVLPGATTAACRIGTAGSGGDQVHRRRRASPRGLVSACGGRQARATVLVFNGNAGNRADRAGLARRLAQAGASVLLFDYRGFAGNPGSPSEGGLVRDARAARAYLDSRPDADPSSITYYGESLGTGVAVAVAVKRPAALVLRSPYTSMVDVGRRHYWYLPVDLLLWDRYPAVKEIRRVRTPMFVIAGSEDRLIPPELSRRLYEAAPGPKHELLRTRRGPSCRIPAHRTGGASCGPDVSVGAGGAR